MIETPNCWYIETVRLRASVLLLPLLLLACTDDGGGEPCEAPVEGLPANYSVSLVGFPEVVDGQLVANVQLDFNGPCVVDAIDFAADQLTLSLACEHPAPSDPGGARVTITTAAAGLPSGVDIGDTLTFDAQAAHVEQTGGDASGPIFRELSPGGPERYELSDEGGPVFALVINDTTGFFGPIKATTMYNCPGWAFCTARTDSIRGYVHASLDDQPGVDVEVGETALLESGDLAWDVTLFQSWLTSDCHDGEHGSLSIVRRP